MDFKKIVSAKWLVPLLAVLVIIESVIIVQKLSEQRSGNWGAADRSLPTSLQPEDKRETQLSLVGENTVEVDEENQLRVVMTPDEQLALDGVDILIEYDPAYIEILEANPSGRFSEVGRNWIEPENERVLVTLVQLDNMVTFEAGQEATLLTLTYQAKQAGETSFRIKKDQTAETNLVGQGIDYSFQTKDLSLIIR